MKIAITTDSTSDLSKELCNQFDIKIIPLNVTFGDVNKRDGEFAVKEIYEYVKKTGELCKTASINQFQYEEFFQEVLKDYDVIIHVGLGSNLSSSFQNARLASLELENKVYVIDSCSLSTGCSLLTIYARELANQGMPIDEIISKVNARVEHVQASFVLQNVNYLYKGGRCSAMALLGANIFHICPQIVVRNGKLESGKKYRGNYDKVVAQYVDDILSEFNHPDLEHVFITESGMDNEELIVNMIREKLTARGFKNIYHTHAGGVIACHCGPNTIGILYINDK